MSRLSQGATAPIAADKPQGASLSRRGWALFLALGLIWGMPYLLIRIALADLHPVMLAAGRTAVGALVLLPIALRGRGLAEAFRAWKWLALYTLAEITAPWVLIGYAETQVPSSTAGLLIALTPLIAAVLATWLGSERPGWRRLMGLALGFLGLVAIYGFDLGTSSSLAVLALILSACGYALGPLILARKLSHLQPLAIVAASLIVAFVLYLPVMPLFWPARVSAAAIGAVLCLGVLCTALAFTLLLGLVAEAGPARATVIAYVNPAVAIVLGVLVLGEALTIGMGLGFVLIIAGSILATSADGSTPGPARYD
jgi:drug/metabolite transporter (DMT)-like permease